MLITYDLHDERDDEGIVAEIKSLGSCVRLEDSVWLVDTLETPSGIRAALRGVTGEATYFVGRLGRNWADHGSAARVSDWLRSPARTW